MMLISEYTPFTHRTEIGCKTTQHFWIESLIKKNKQNSHHRTFHLKNDSDSDKN
jgi:hypothetical protein